MAANPNDNETSISYDPEKFGYSVVNEAPEVNENHRKGEVYFSEEILEREIE